MRWTRDRLPLLGALAALAAAFVSCASTPDEGSTRPGNTSGTDGSGGLDLGGSSSVGEGGAGAVGFEACAEASELAELVPVYMFITIDRSISMLSDGKWDTAKAAFIAFFQLAEADSLNVALRFWEGDADGCDGKSCDPVACSKPEVDLGSLADPAHEAALIALYESKAPQGGTPMSAALEGACLWATEHQKTAQGPERYVVMLVTDGKPAKCETDVSLFDDAAQAAFDEAGVLTFAVGLDGSHPDVMDQIAAAGGTGKGYMIGAANAEADLLAALLAIQTSTAACSFAMPAATGEAIDPSKVNVTFTPRGSSAKETIKQIAGADACAEAGGWFYDDPSSPSAIVLCPATCSAIQADAGGSLEIVLGCETQLG